MKTEAPLLEIKNLCLSYFTRTGEIPAVINFSLSIKAGECVGLVGESGCGKSTIAMGIMRYMGSNGNIVGERFDTKAVIWRHFQDGSCDVYAAPKSPWFTKSRWLRLTRA